MASSQTPSRLPSRRAAGVALVLSPFVLAVLGALWLYLWIAANGYQGDGSVGAAWFVYAISGLAYLWPAVLLISGGLLFAGASMLGKDGPGERRR